MPQIELYLPITTVSEANWTGHWARAAERHRCQRKAVFAYMASVKVTLPCEIQLIRYAPRKLDESDNLPMSMKWIKDAIAEKILGGRSGQHDDHPNLIWHYSQVTGRQKGVKIILTFE